MKKNNRMCCQDQENVVAHWIVLIMTSHQEPKTAIISMIHSGNAELHLSWLSCFVSDEQASLCVSMQITLFYLRGNPERFKGPACKFSSIQWEERQLQTSLESHWISHVLLAAAFRENSWNPELIQFWFQWICSLCKYKYLLVANEKNNTYFFFFSDLILLKPFHSKPVCSFQNITLGLY